MGKSKVKVLLIGLAVMFLFFLVACSNGGKNSGENERNEINVRITSDPDFLDPHLATASITDQMILNIFEGLLAPKTDGTLEPGLAESYTVSDDGTTYTFKLRKGVVFHNGDPLTVEDVVYSFERLTGLGGEDPLSGDFGSIIALEAPDDETFIVHLSEPNSAFLSYLTGKDSAIIPKSNDGKHNDNPIGTGPFKFKEYNPGSNLIVEKNEDYWKDGIPYLDKVTFRFQGDNQAALMSMKAGELDLMDVPPHRISEVENEFNIILEQANSTLIMGFNHEKEPFNDVKVRQAINLAINKDDMIEAAFSGYAVKLGSNMSPAMGVFHKEGLENMYETDIERAKQLLAEAGYPDGFSTTLSISSHNAMYTDIAQVAVENLRQIGIDVEIEVVEWGVWLERIYRGRDFEMTAIDFTGKLDPHDILVRYISDMGNNFMNYANAEYDQIMKDVLLEDNESERVKYYHRAQEILAETAAAVFILDYQFVWVLNKDLEGYKTYPFFFHDLSEVRFKQ